MSYLSKSEAVTALRAAADLLERLALDKSVYVNADLHNLTADQLAAAACQPGTWEKGAIGDDLFKLSQGIVNLHGNRQEVCKARPTGRKVTARKLVASAVFEEVEVDEIEWECLPLLANGATR